LQKFPLQLLEEKYEGVRNRMNIWTILFARLQLDMNFFQQDLKELVNSTDNKLLNFQQIYIELLEWQRKMLIEMNRKDEFDEELIRKYLGLIDMEEFKIREKQLQEI
jgi:CPA1 family monovalent cation:H+ antiporter